MTCWSSKSRLNSSKPSDPSACGQSCIGVETRTSPSMAETALRGRIRLPDEVFTMIAAIFERSSCGASATSRTRPLAAPVESYTVEPSNSLRASVLIVTRIQNWRGGIQIKTRQNEYFSALSRRRPWMAKPSVPQSAGGFKPVRASRV